MPGVHSTGAWRQLRAQQLRLEPTCRFCRQAGRVVPATVVDHIRPHRGDPALFSAAANLQSLCKPCHDAVKQSYEKRGGLLRGNGLGGLPLDSAHPWFREGAIDD